MTQSNDTTPQQEIRLIPIDMIHTGNNDRTVFDLKELQDLAESIRQNGKGKEGKGLIQPLTVTLFTPDPRYVFGGDRFGDIAQYTLVAGERRLRACKILGWKVVPAIIADLTPQEAAAIMLSENVSRKDLDFRLKLLKLREDFYTLIRSGQFPWRSTNTAKIPALCWDGLGISSINMRSNRTSKI